MRKLIKGGLTLVASTLLLQNPANAISITVDQILADQPTGLSGTVDMSFLSGTSLQITLANMSAAGSATGANGLLTGLAFNLPGGNNILGGSVALGAGSTFVNSVAGDLSKEWGFQNSSAPGHFNGMAIDTVVATMSADTTAKFGDGKITNPDVLSGPDYGLVRKGGDPGGLSAVQNSIIITLTLQNSVGDAAAQAAYLDSINKGLVAIEFGSPTGVPDGGSTLVLLGSALTGLVFLARRRKMASQA